MIPPRRSIPLDYEVEPQASEVHREWPQFDDGPLMPKVWFWLAMAAGAVLCAFGLGWLAMELLA